MPVYKRITNPKRNLIESVYALKKISILDVSIVISYSNIFSNSLCVDLLRNGFELALKVPGDATMCACLEQLSGYAVMEKVTLPMPFIVTLFLREITGCPFPLSVTSDGS